MGIDKKVGVAPIKDTIKRDFTNEFEKIKLRLSEIKNGEEYSRVVIELVNTVKEEIYQENYSKKFRGDRENSLIEWADRAVLSTYGEAGGRLAAGDDIEFRSNTLTNGQRLTDNSDVSEAMAEYVARYVNSRGMSIVTAVVGSGQSVVSYDKGDFSKFQIESKIKGFE